MGERVEGGPDAHPLLRRGVGDVQHADEPRRHRGGAVGRPVTLAVGGGDHVEHLRGGGHHQRTELLDGVGALALAPPFEGADALGGHLGIGRIDHGFLLPDALDGSDGSRSSERGKPSVYRTHVRGASAIQDC
jgi:hypothetical protein